MTITKLEIYIAIEIQKLRAPKSNTIKDIREYSDKKWAWRSMLEYLRTHESEYVNAVTAVESYILHVDDLLCMAKTERAKCTYIACKDTAEYTRDLIITEYEDWPWI